MNFGNVNRLDIPEGRVMKITCAGAVLWKPPAAMITRQPQSVVAVWGSTATISVGATGAESYEWQIRAGEAQWDSLIAYGWAGAATDTLKLENAGAYQAERVYRCKVTGYDGGVVYTDTAGLTLRAACEITTQPEDARAFVGRSASFTIAAENTTYYELQSSADGGATWSKVTGKGQGGSTLLSGATLQVNVTEENVSHLYRIELRDTSWHAAYSEIVRIEERINLMRLSTETDGKTIYNGGLGYKNNTRLNSSAVETALTGYAVCGYIKAKAGDVVRVQGLQWDASVNGGCYFWTFDASHAKLKCRRPDGSGSADINSTNEGNDVTAFKLEPYNTAVAYIRLSAYGSGENLIVTVNDPI